jgi:hypothetical protein
MEADTKLTVHDVVSRLEEQQAFHTRQAELHRQQEAEHRSQGEYHAAMAKETAERLAVFREAAQPAMALVGPPVPAAPSVEELELDGPVRLPGLVQAVTRDFGPQEPFGVTRVLEELVERYGRALKRRPRRPHVAVALRRMAADGRLHQLRPGRPHREALYTREAPAARA